MNLQPSPSALRHRKFSARRKEGLIVVPVQVDEFAVTDFLVSARFLKSSDVDDRAQVSNALAEMIDRIIKERL